MGFAHVLDRALPGDQRAVELYGRDGVPSGSPLHTATPATCASNTRECNLAEDLQLNDTTCAVFTGAKANFIPLEIQYSTSALSTLSFCAILSSLLSAICDCAFRRTVRH